MPGTARVCPHTSCTATHMSSRLGHCSSAPLTIYHTKLASSSHLDHATAPPQPGLLLAPAARCCRYTSHTDLPATPWLPPTACLPPTHTTQSTTLQQPFSRCVKPRSKPVYLVLALLAHSIPSLDQRLHVHKAIAPVRLDALLPDMRIRPLQSQPLGEALQVLQAQVLQGRQQAVSVLYVQASACTVSASTRYAYTRQVCLLHNTQYAVHQPLCHERA